jgi:hypothetical protein
MEAYTSVYEPKQEISEEKIWEEVENWVNSLLEEGYDLSEYTWEEMYEEYITEYGGIGAAEAQQRTLSQTAQNAARVNSGGTLGAGGGQAAMKALQAKGASPRSAYATVYIQGQKNIQQAGRQPAQSTGMYGRYAPPSMQQKTPTPATQRPAAPAAAPRPAAAAPAAASRPAAGAPAAAPRPSAGAPAAAPRPSGGQSSDMNANMSAWRKANPTLAAAADEKARIRGTQQTDNPMMKDMKSNLPMNSPSVQAPAVAKLGAGNQSLTQNPNAFKAATPAPSTTSATTSSLGQRAFSTPSLGASQFKSTTPSAAISAAPSTSPAASGSVVPATNKIAAMNKQPTMVPSRTLSQSYEYEDAYDVVLEYLLDTGHAESIAEAQYIMTEMDEETIAEIYKGRHGQSDTEYMDSRSDAAKQISGDSKHSGASYSHRSFKGVGKPALPGERQPDQGRMTNADRNELAIRKANLKKKG